MFLNLCHCNEYYILCWRAINGRSLLAWSLLTSNAKNSWQCKITKIFLHFSHLPDGRSYPIFYHKSITVDDTEKLCYPKGRTFIGGQSIASTFLCSSAVCLLIGWNVKFFFRIFNFEDLQNWRIWCKKISKNNFWK